MVYGSLPFILRGTAYTLTVGIGTQTMVSGLGLVINDSSAGAGWFRPTLIVDIAVSVRVTS